MNSKPRRVSPALVISVIALVLALGGSAIAAKRYLITTPKQISPKVLRELATMAARQGSIGAAGAQGAPGPKGPEGDKGPTGDQGPRGVAGSLGDAHWAVIDPNGTVSRASDAGTTAQKLAGEGSYAVVFGEDVTQCAYEATIGLSGTEAVENPGFATVVRWSESPDGVLVQTYNETGDLADKGVHLTVLC